MKKIIGYLAGGAIAILMWGCSPMVYTSASTYSDDMYAAHDRQAIAKQVAAQRELARQEAEAAAQAAREYERQQSNPYEEILADDYESAYKRRLKGFESPTYKMPSSYYNFRYGDQAQYASAYDPSFYNVMVMGDQVWVEPKYVTSMFGSWGTPVNVNVNLGWGWGGAYWGNPWWGWNSPYYGGWHNYWNSPYYSWGYPGWGYPNWGYPSWGYPSWGGGHWHGYYPNNVTYRPSYSRYDNGQRGYNSGYRSPSKYSSGSTYRNSNSGNSYRNRNDKSNQNNSGRYDNSSNRNQSNTRPSYTPPSQPSYSPSTGGGSSNSGGSYGGSSNRSSGGSRGR